VAGSSGHATFLQRERHPAMFVTLLQMGSMVIDVSGNRLDAMFLRETGAIDDHFTILKGEPAEPLRIVRARVNSGQVTVGWKSRAGAKYRIEQTLDMENPAWEVASPDVIATGATTSWSGAAEADLRVFFRVVEVQQ